MISAGDFFLCRITFACYLQIGQLRILLPLTILCYVVFRLRVLVFRHERSEMKPIVRCKKVELFQIDGSVYAATYAAKTAATI